MHSLLFHPYTVVSFAETLHSIWFTSGLCAMEMVTALDGMCFPSMTQFQWGSFNFLTWFVWWLHLVRRWYKVGCYFVLPLIWDVCSIYIRFSESHRLPLTCPRRWWNVFFFFCFSERRRRQLSPMKERNFFFFFFGHLSGFADGTVKFPHVWGNYEYSDNKFWQCFAKRVPFSTWRYICSMY